jgi:hypothetical protein
MTLLDTDDRTQIMHAVKRLREEAFHAGFQSVSNNMPELDFRQKRVEALIVDIAVLIGAEVGQG